MKNLVLLVESDPQIAAEVAKTLINFGYEVVVAVDVLEARACLDVAHFDMVISTDPIPELGKNEHAAEPFATNTRLVG